MMNKRKKTVAVMENSSPEDINRGLRCSAGPRGDIWQQHAKLGLMISSPLCRCNRSLSLSSSSISVSST